MVNSHKVGLVFALSLGGWHLLWSLLVLLGLAQPVINFIFWAHMIHLPINAGPFDFTAAVTLIIVTGVLGYVIGSVVAWIWNSVHK